MTRVNKGIRFEYAIRDQYRKRGWYVMRSAGSHGVYDLVAFDPVSKVVEFIQLKRGSKAYLASQKDLIAHQPFTAEVRFIVISKED